MLLCLKKAMKNILVPCDFSKPAEEAFKFAVNIAQQSDGQVHVLYVVDITFLNGNPTLTHSYAFNVNFLNDIEKETEQKFQKMWERHAPLTMKVKFKHVISSLTAEAERYIVENGIDLVVMGTHGQGNAGFGSNTERVVRHATVPVLSVRTCPAKIKNIVLPVMSHKLDDRFVQAIKNLQTFFDAKLHLLYVNTPLYFRNDRDSLNDLEGFARKTFSNYSVQVRSDYSVEEGIAHYAHEINADMIAMGTHAWKGLMHLIVGSITEDIVSRIPMPIWTYSLK
jgi:nucleotide-binding universal stress UspA family protein